MESTGARLLAVGSPPVLLSKTASSAGNSTGFPAAAAWFCPQVLFRGKMTALPGSSGMDEGRTGLCLNSSLRCSPVVSLEDEEVCPKSLNDYFDENKAMIESNTGAGPPRWFSPLECSAQCCYSPLLLFLPGIDGVGLGLIRQHRKLGRMFDIWCLHIPVRDRTPFQELVEMVKRTVKESFHLSPKRPIYLVGESLGACIALAVAASFPDVDLVLILANPATSFGNSSLRTSAFVAKALPDQLQVAAPYFLSLITGFVVNSHSLSFAFAIDGIIAIGVQGETTFWSPSCADRCAPFKTVAFRWVEGLPPRQTIANLFQDLVTISGYHSVLTDILPRDTLIWKLQLLESASASVNALLHRVKAKTLVLSSGKDALLPSQDEGKRLRKTLPRCEIRNFRTCGHFFFLEDGIDLASIIKATAFYHREKHSDPVSSYVPATIAELKRFSGANGFYEIVTGTVMLSSKEDGRIVRGLGGIPSEGPVLIVGNHMLIGCDLVSICRFFIQRKIILRALAHPLMFSRSKNGHLPDVSVFDVPRMMGIVPVSNNNLHRLLASKSHVLLYPGGIREALHRKGEAHKLFWPTNPEFVRMSAKFGAKIVPFGVVGDDDVFEEIFDYNDQIKIPFLKSLIESMTSETVNLRSQAEGELGNQDLHVPGIIPKVPGRFYFYFAKPIDLRGRKDVLADKEKARELYAEVKSEVERCIAFLKEKREHDPYRGLLPRLNYHFKHGFGAEPPTFDF